LSPRASSVSTPSSGSEPGRSRAIVGPVLPPTLTPIEHALSRRRLPSANETSNLCGNVGAPTLRASAGGTIECVALVSTKKSAVALCRADSLALTTM